jgi:hypothetical protein
VAVATVIALDADFGCARQLETSDMIVTGLRAAAVAAIKRKLRIPPFLFLVLDPDPEVSTVISCCSS